ncbi:hypothetical protein C8R43DRAFT_42966 [Mycena crocata]|nr:hypothetical protein C8R43DRAFT_42966 [Mycena crocata]
MQIIVNLVSVLLAPLIRSSRCYSPARPLAFQRPNCCQPITISVPVARTTRHLQAHLILYLVRTSSRTQSLQARNRKDSQFNLRPSRWRPKAESIFRGPTPFNRIIIKIPAEPSYPRPNFLPECSTIRTRSRPTDISDLTMPYDSFTRIVQLWD